MTDLESKLIHIDLSLWKEYIETTDYEEINDMYTIIRGTREDGEDSASICATLYETQIEQFPIRCGDIVTHKDFGGRFIVYDYPILDKRKDQKILKYPKEEMLLYMEEIYYVDGILNNGQEAGYNRLAPAKSLSEKQCHWKNFTVIDHVTNLLKSDPLYKVHLNCIKEYPGYLEDVKKDLKMLEGN